MPTRKDEDQEQVRRDVRPPAKAEDGGQQAGPPQPTGSESVPPPDQRTWTRGDDPEAAAQALLEANRGTTGGEYNASLQPRTPQSAEQQQQDQ